jgi:hypothetical protein
LRSRRRLAIPVVSNGQRRAAQRPSMSATSSLGAYDGERPDPPLTWGMYYSTISYGDAFLSGAVAAWLWSPSDGDPRHLSRPPHVVRLYRGFRRGLLRLGHPLSRQQHERGLFGYGAGSLHRASMNASIHRRARRQKMPRGRNRMLTRSRSWLARFLQVSSSLFSRFEIRLALGPPDYDCGNEDASEEVVGELLCGGA